MCQILKKYFKITLDKSQKVDYNINIAGNVAKSELGAEGYFFG